MKYRIIYIPSRQQYDIEKKSLFSKWKFVTAFDTSDEAINYIKNYYKGNITIINTILPPETLKL